MFEQSILPNYSGSQKKNAIAASFMAQILAAGVLVIVPLVSHEVLPALRMNTPISIDLTPFQPAPERKPTQGRPASSSSLLRTARPFVPIIRSRPDADVFRSQALVDFGDAPYSSTFDAGVATPHFAERSGPIVQFKPPALPAKPDEPKPAKPVTVTSEIQSAKILRKVIPVYPLLAKQARIQGTVRLVGIIAKDGTVQQLHVQSGHPLLVKAALDAVAQWIYRPTILNSEPVEVIAPIDVIFTLQQ